MPNIAKAYAISDAKISYVSLVEKAANKHKFLITKADDGKARFQTCGRIVKAEDEDEQHFVTGIVYEPMTEDSQGNFMTEDEITKAAHWYMRNSGKVDIQHDFEAVDKSSACVVESWIAKSDSEIGDTPIKKGTWLMTMEISDPDIWDKITKGDITGFSMGGVGIYSDKDEDLDKADADKISKAEKESLWHKIGKALGVAPIAKGEVKDSYARQSKSSNLYTAWDCLESQLYQWSPDTGKYEYTSDKSKIREYLQDFNDIVTGILKEDDDSIFKSCTRPAEIAKSGRKMSGKNKKALAGIIQSLNSFAEMFEDPTEPENDGTEDEKKDEDNGKDESDDKDEKSKDSKDSKDSKTDDADSTKDQKKEESMTKKEAEELIRSMITKSQSQEQPQADPETVTKSDNDEVTEDDIKKMAEEAIKKAEEPEKKQEPEKDLVTKAEAQKMVNDAVAAIMKSRGIPTNLNNEEQSEEVKKADEQCYLHGVL